MFMFLCVCVFVYAFLLLCFYGNVEIWEYAFVKSVFNIYETVYQEIKRKRCKRTEVQKY
jgi:hypothetical protein